MPDLPQSPEQIKAMDSCQGCSQYQLMLDSPDTSFSSLGMYSFTTSIPQRIAQLGKHPEHPWIRPQQRSLQHRDIDSIEPLA